MIDAGGPARRKPPFGALGGFLRAVADGGLLPALPGALPDELRQVLEALAEAVREDDPAG